jgi:hypothetical protein|tara:strand:+ start:52 stop:492 length:441 start_codon:yes stop_codon:yes gene_type:complete
MAKIQIHKPKIQIPKQIKKSRQSDSKVNTAKEMINASEEALWGKNPVEALKFERIEMRKKMNWVARFSLSLITSGTFLILLYLLFFSDLKDGHRDLINILVGAYVGVLAKSTDYWFKDKDDAEDKESQQLHEKALLPTTNGENTNG